MSRARSSTGMAGESAAFRMLARSRSNTWTPAADNPHADVPCQRLELGMGGGGGGRGGLNSLTSRHSVAPSACLLVLCKHHCSWLQDGLDLQRLSHRLTEESLEWRCEVWTTRCLSEQPP